MQHWEQTQCSVPGCAGPVHGFVVRNEVYVGQPTHIDQVGLCASHVAQVVHLGPKSLKRPA